MSNEQWLDISTAPHRGYILGYDPCLKHPFIMHWNEPGKRFTVNNSVFRDEMPTHWMPLPPIPPQKK